MTQRIVSVDLGFINCHQMARLLSNMHFIAHYTNQMALRWNRPLLTHSHPIRSWNEKVRRLPEGVNWFPEYPTTENINSHSPKLSSISYLNIHLFILINHQSIRLSHTLLWLSESQLGCHEQNIYQASWNSLHARPLILYRWIACENWFFDFNYKSNLVDQRTCQRVVSPHTRCVYGQIVWHRNLPTRWKPQSGFPTPQSTSGTRPDGCGVLLSAASQPGCLVIASSGHALECGWENIIIFCRVCVLWIASPGDRR